MSTFVIFQKDTERIDDKKLFEISKHFHMNTEIPVTDGFSPTIRKEGGNLTIEWNGVECLGSTVNVFDLNGGRLLSHPVQIAEPETKIPIETIYAGFCIVHIRTEKSTFTKKIKL